MLRDCLHLPSYDVYWQLYINQLATRYALAGGSKLVDDCRRGTPGVFFGVPFCGFWLSSPTK